MNKFALFFFALLAFSTIASADTTYTCLSEDRSQALTLTTEGSDAAAPNSIILEGLFPHTLITFKASTKGNERNPDMTRYVGQHSMPGFRHEVQQTVFLSRTWSENSGRLLQVVVGGEKISYENFNCSED